jgi:hypothetical protein
MTGGILLSVMFATSLHAQAVGHADLDDMTQPRGQVRRLSDSEVATYVVNHGIWPAGIVGEVGEWFEPDGTTYRSRRVPQQGTYKIGQDRLCVIYSGIEICRSMYVDEDGVVFSSRPTRDVYGSDVDVTSLVPLSREPGR